jgi:hypothetical protein
MDFHQTPAEQICEMVAEYYANLGIPMPKSDWEDCKTLLRAERARNYEPEGWEWLKDYKPKQAKPEFGTPEFWSYMRKQKKERLAAEAQSK